MNAEKVLSLLTVCLLVYFAARIFISLGKSVYCRWLKK